MATFKCLLMSVRYQGSHGVYGSHTFSNGQMSPSAPLCVPPDINVREPERPAPNTNEVINSVEPKAF